MHRFFYHSNVRTDRQFCDAELTPTSSQSSPCSRDCVHLQLVGLVMLRYEQGLRDEGTAQLKIGERVGVPLQQLVQRRDAPRLPQQRMCVKLI